jgi:hypothetical protein
MKNAQVALWNSKPSQNPQAPILYGSVRIPSQLVMELAQLVQYQQGHKVDERTGEQYFDLRLSIWRGTGENNGPVLRGEFKSPAEQAAYEQQKAAQQAAGGGWGGQPQAQPQAFGQPAAAPAGVPQHQQPAGYPPAGVPPAGMPPAGAPPAGVPPMVAPMAQPAPAAAPPAWGGGGWGG